MDHTVFYLVIGLIAQVACVLDVRNQLPPLIQRAPRPRGPRYPVVPAAVVPVACPPPSAPTPCQAHAIKSKASMSLRTTAKAWLVKRTSSASGKTLDWSLPGMGPLANGTPKVI